MAAGSRSSLYDHLAKLLLIGDSGVGKSSLLIQFAEGAYDPNMPETIGMDFKVKVLELGGLKVKLQIWDTAGQERFNTITQQYYRNAMGIILVYDATSEESFGNIRRWAAQISAHAAQGTSRLLVGNKADCENRAVDSERGQELAREYGIGFFETSAKSGLNVQQAFEAIARDVVLNRQTKDGSVPAKGAAPIQLRRKLALPDETAGPQSGCCAG